MIAPAMAIVGGYMYAERQVCPEEWSEGLDGVTVRPGLGLTTMGIDVHAAQADLSISIERHPEGRLCLMGSPVQRFDRFARRCPGTVAQQTGLGGRHLLAQCLTVSVFARRARPTPLDGRPEPRAQAFYRRHGLAPDGTEKVDDDVREIYMTRNGSNART